MSPTRAAEKEKKEGFEERPGQGRAAVGIAEKLLSDSDTLLIGALMYLLYTQGADKKLLLALLYILIG